MRDQRHQDTRKFLRVLGPCIVGIGLIFTLIGLVSFFSAFGNFGSPRYFWCAFIGLPMMGFGAMITQFAYVGAIMKFQAREMTPVATETFNDVVDGTQSGMRKMARAVSGGIQEGISGSEVNDCSRCGHSNDADARFCSDCGESMTSVRVCSSCRAANDQTAAFCDQCGQSLA